MLAVKENLKEVVQASCEFLINGVFNDHVENTCEE